jgi:hypothetical protein
VYEDLKIKHTRIPVFTFVSNQASVLDTCCTYFLYLSIGLQSGNYWKLCVSHPSMNYACYHVWVHY